MLAIVVINISLWEGRIGPCGLVQQKVAELMTPISILDLIMIGVEGGYDLKLWNLRDLIVGCHLVTKWSHWVDNQARRSHSHIALQSPGGGRLPFSIHLFVQKISECQALFSPWRRSSEQNR